MESVTLYRAPTAVADTDAIADWLDARIEATVSVRDRFLSLHGDSELAESFAEARVLSPYDRETGNTMLGTSGTRNERWSRPSGPAASSTTGWRSSRRSTSESPNPSGRWTTFTSHCWTASSGPGATTTVAGTRA